MNVKAILSALPYVIRSQAEEYKYRVYVTDGLYVLCGGHMTQRYEDAIKRSKKCSEDARTGDELAHDLIAEMGLIYDESI